MYDLRIRELRIHSGVLWFGMSRKFGEIALETEGRDVLWTSQVIVVSIQVGLETGVKPVAT